jgi:hypothetical protein
MYFNEKQREALATLKNFNEEQIFWLLGEIVEPSIDGPFAGIDDDFSDDLIPITKAYRDSYDHIAAGLGANA